MRASRCLLPERYACPAPPHFAPYDHDTSLNLQHSRGMAFREFDNEMSRIDKEEKIRPKQKKPQENFSDPHSYRPELDLRQYPE